MNTLHPDLERYRFALRRAIENDLERRKARRHIRMRLVRIGVPGLAGGLGLSLALVFAGTQAAFAGWSPTPTPASSGQTTSADATCQAQLAEAPPGASGVATGNDWKVVTTDVRGPFTLVVYQGGSGGATCLTGPSVTVVSQRTGSGGSESVSRGVRSSGQGSGISAAAGSSFLSSSSGGSIKNMTLTHLASTSQGAFTVVEGQVVDGVTDVTLGLGDGEHVQASATDGWFVAWWPGSEDSTSAEITTANGVTTQTLTTQPLPQPPLVGEATCRANSQTTSSGPFCTGGAPGHRCARHLNHPVGRKDSSRAGGQTCPASSTVSSAAGSASRRSSGMGSPLRTE